MSVCVCVYLMYLVHNRYVLYLFGIEGIYICIWHRGYINTKYIGYIFIMNQIHRVDTHTHIFDT